MRTGELNFTLPAFNLSMHLNYMIKTHKMLLKAIEWVLKGLVTEDSNRHIFEELGMAKQLRMCLDTSKPTLHVLC